MYKETHVKIPIYFGDLKIIVTDDLQRVGDKYDLGDTAEWDAITFTLTKNGYHRFCLAFKTNVTLSIVCHETVHAVNRIFDTRGVKLDLLNDEPQAYLSGWVFNECYKFLNRVLNKDENSKKGTVAAS